MRKFKRAYWRKLTCKQRRHLRWKAQQKLDEKHEEIVAKTGNTDLKKVVAGWRHISVLLGG